MERYNATSVSFFSRLLLATIMCIFGALLVNAAFAKSHINEETIRLALKSGNLDDILRLLNDVKGMHYQGQVLPYLDALWHKKINEYPDEPWEVINLDIVRLEIGNTLIQADNNNIYKTDRGGIHKFVRKTLSTTNDYQLIQYALLTISLFDSEEDVELIVSIAKKEDRRTFRSAVLALADMCNEKAKTALVSLSNQLKREDYREYVRIKSKELHELQKKWRLCEPIE